MDVTKEETWHIYQVMKERGASHCKECEKIFDKLKADLDKFGLSEESE